MGRSTRVAVCLTIAAVLPLAGCEDPTVVRPAPLDDSSKLFSVSGIVTEMTPQRGRPSTGAPVYALIRGGAFNQWPTTLTDENGRYSLSGLKWGSTIRLGIEKEGYFQQCAAPEVNVKSDLRIYDGQIVAADQLSASP